MKNKNTACMEEKIDHVTFLNIQIMGGFSHWIHNCTLRNTFTKMISIIYTWKWIYTYIEQRIEYKWMVE